MSPGYLSLSEPLRASPPLLYWLGAGLLDRRGRDSFMDPKASERWLECIGKRSRRGLAEFGGEG